MSLEECIQSLARQQFDLRCEKVMHTIQTFNHDEYSLKLLDDYLLFHFKLKNHFLHLRDVVSSVEFPQKTQNLFSSIQLPKQKNIKVFDKFHIKSLVYFIEKLMENDGHKFKINLNNQDFISTLTFSLFPSISTYFHINLVPTLKKGEDVFDFQSYNYNNVFLYLSDLIQKCDNPEKKSFYQTIFDLLMRPMFASPLFIKFCIKFFQPLFSELQDKEIKDGFKDFSITIYLLSQFDSYFDLYLHLIPPFILINLRASDDPIRTLRASFFEIALSSVELSQFYGLFHYSKPPNQFILKSIRYIFMQSQEVINMFAVRFISVGDIVLQQMQEWKQREKLGEINIITCSCSETKLTNAIDDVKDAESRVGLALDMKNYYFEENVLVDQNKQYLNKILLNSADIDLISYIYEEGNDNDTLFKLSANTNNDSFFYINFDEINNNLSENNDNDHIDFITKTVKNKPDELAPNLRHLLQNSDPLPNFTKIPSIKIEEFFDQYLVLRGPVSLLSKRKVNKNAIFKLLPKKENLRIKRILEALPNTSLGQDKEIQKLTIDSLIKKKIGKILFLCEQVDHIYAFIDNTILLQGKKSAVYFQNFKSNLNKNYIKNPKLFESDIEFNKANLDKNIFKDSKVVLMKMIDKAEDKSDVNVFGFGKIKIIYRPFFLDYVLTSTTNAQIDSKLNLLLKNSGEKIIKLSLESNFPTKNVNSRNRLAKNKHIIEKIHLIRKIRAEIINDCNESFSEYSILRKVELFDNCYREVKNYIDEGLPNFVDAIGADEMTPLMALVIFIANPSYIVCNSEILKTYFSTFNDTEFTSHLTIMVNSISSTLLDLRRTLIENNSLMKSQNEFINCLNGLFGE